MVGSGQLAEENNFMKNILIITQKIDNHDDLLGFFHAWTEEFSRHCSRVVVICLQKGEVALPSNVEVLSLGKESLSQGKRLKKLSYLIKFYSYIWNRRNDYDAVFVHMNIEYVILGGIFWRLWGKKIGLWYAHGGVSWRLRLAEKLAQIIFTSTPSGFRLPSKKLHVVGQGIDTNKFVPAVERNKEGIFKLIMVGRISPVKRHEEAILALTRLKNVISPFKLQIIGVPALASDERYLTKIKALVEVGQLTDSVGFVGAVANKDLVGYLQQADLLLNPSQTGSLDKVMPEAMACGVPIVTSNEAIKSVLPNDFERFFFTPGNIDELKDKIKYFYQLKGSDQIFALGDRLRRVVMLDHSLSGLIKKIISLYA